MNLLVVGLSHRTAPLDIRERLAFPSDALHDDLRRVAGLRGVGEAMIISTCNRVEVWATAIDPPVAVGLIGRDLADRHSIDADKLRGYLYDHSGDSALRHAFRVASSLDSMVVGEPQILGQFREAFAQGVSAGTVGQNLQRCMHRAFTVAKRVRRETAIGRESVSISSVAVDLARKIFGDLNGKTVLLVGAGKMSELALRKLREVGVSRLLIANRSPARAEQLATECGGTAADLARLGELLVEADIVFTSTAATEYLVRREMAASAMKARRYRPLFLIDVAVPRNVEPRVNDVSNVYLYDVDDLQHVVASNQAERLREAAAAEKIVAREVEAFAQWQQTLDVVPTVVALRDRLHTIREAETDKVLRKLDGLSERDRRLVEHLGKAIVNKVLHVPVTALKKDGGSGEPTDLVGAARELFGLEEEVVSEPDGGSEATAREPAQQS